MEGARYVRSVPSLYYLCIHMREHRCIFLFILLLVGVAQLWFTNFRKFSDVSHGNSLWAGSLAWTRRLYARHTGHAFSACHISPLCATFSMAKEMACLDEGLYCASLVSRNYGPGLLYPENIFPVVEITFFVSAQSFMLTTLPDTYSGIRDCRSKKSCIRGILYVMYNASLIKNSQKHRFLLNIPYL